MSHIGGEGGLAMICPQNYSDSLDNTHGLSIFPECGKGEKRTWNAGNSLCNKAVHSPSAHTAFVKTCSCLLLAAGEARTSNY